MKKGVPDLDDRGRLGGCTRGGRGRGGRRGAGAARERSPSMTDRPRAVWPLREGPSARWPSAGWSHAVPGDEYGPDASILDAPMGRLIYFSWNRVPREPIVAPGKGRTRELGVGGRSGGTRSARVVSLRVPEPFATIRSPRPVVNPVSTLFSPAVRTARRCPLPQQDLWLSRSPRKAPDRAPVAAGWGPRDVGKSARSAIDSTQQDSDFNP